MWRKKLWFRLVLPGVFTSCDAGDDPGGEARTELLDMALSAAAGMSVCGDGQGTKWELCSPGHSQPTPEARDRTGRIQDQSQSKPQTRDRTERIQGQSQPKPEERGCPQCIHIQSAFMSFSSSEFT